MILTYGIHNSICDKYRCDFRISVVFSYLHHFLMAIIDVHCDHFHYYYLEYTVEILYLDSILNCDSILVVF